MRYDPVRDHSVYRIKLEDNKSICDFFNLSSCSGEYLQLDMNEICG